MLCSKFNYLNQQPVFSGGKNTGPDGVPEGDPEGGSEWDPEGVQKGVQIERSTFCTDLKENISY